MVNLLILLILNLVLCYCDEQLIQSSKTGDHIEGPGYSSTSQSKEECVRRIYRECNQPTHFTEEELENVRQFLNYSFTQLADIKPDKPLCPKLHVRQDWKCLTERQKHRIINIFLQLYERGVIQNLTDIHERYWPAWHKGAEFFPGHRWLINELENYMRAIDPSVALPYWEPYLYSSQPERSSIWDTLGHSGNYSNGYCVTDGIYKGFVPCVKRHWSPRRTIYPWSSLEFYSHMIQKANSYVDLNQMSTGHHFMPHLNIGGYEGQYAVPTAPYDCIFYMHHHAFNNNLIFKWQLSKRQFLTPLSYDESWRYNIMNGNVEQAHIKTDYLNGVPGVTVRETFWVGFGDHCYIADQFVKPINRIMRGESDPIPTAVNRLPEWIVAKYFPAFHGGKNSSILHMFEEVGNCNTECQPIPKPTYYYETEIGKRMLTDKAYDVGHDLTGSMVSAQQYNYEFWQDINRSGYCSPYVTTY